MNGCVRVAGFDPTAVRGAAEPLDRRRGRQGRRRGHGGARRLSASTTRRRRSIASSGTSFCDWYIELAKPVFAGDGSRGQGRDAGDDGLDHRCHPDAAASLHAVHHRGALGHQGRRGDRRARPYWRWLSWPRRAGCPCRRGLCGGRLADRPRVGHPLHPLRAETCRRPPSCRWSSPRPTRALRDKLDPLGRDAARRLARVPSCRRRRARCPRGSVPVTAAGAVGCAAARRRHRHGRRAKLRLDKESRKLEADIGKIDAKLGSADFLRRAPEEVVEENRERRAEAQDPPRQAARRRRPASRLADRPRPAFPA